MSKRLAELFLGTEDAGLDRAKRQVEGGSDFFIGKLILVPERDQQAILLVEIFNRLMQISANFVGFKLLCGGIEVGFWNLFHHIVTEIVKGTTQVRQSV